MKKTAIAIMAVLAVAGTMALYAQGGPGCSMRGGPDGAGRCGGPRFDGPGPGGPAPCMMMCGKVLKKVGASDEQIQAAKSMMVEQRRQQIKLQADEELANLDLQVLMDADKPDSAAIMKAVDALNQVRGDMFKAQITKQLKMKEILGDELCGKMMRVCQMRPNDKDRQGGKDKRHEGEWKNKKNERHEDSDKDDDKD